MSHSVGRIYDLITDLEKLMEEGYPLWIGRLLVKTKDLQRIIEEFPNAIEQDVIEAGAVLRRREEILQDAQMKANRILEQADAERARRLSESSIMQELEENAQQFKQNVLQECENVKIKAFNEAESVRLEAKEEAIKIREGAQNYAKDVLDKLEQDLNQHYQIVVNGQQYLNEMRGAPAQPQKSPMIDLDKK